MDPAEKAPARLHLGDTSTPNGDDNAYWVDLTTIDPDTGFPPISVLTVPAGSALSRPVAAFFSTDSTKRLHPELRHRVRRRQRVQRHRDRQPSAYNISSPRPPALSPGIHRHRHRRQQWPVSGARIGLIDLTANKLYVAGSTAT